MPSPIELARVEGDSIKGIRPLQEYEIQEIRNCNKEIFDFNRHFKLVEYVLYNFDCLKSVIENSILGFSESSEAIGRYDLDPFGHEVNINLLNLMMSARTCLDHMETFIKREYGKDSKEITLFKRLAADEFDNKFSYKFMYKLRNYVQHCGMPPLSYSKTKVLKGEAPYAALTLEFDRDALLSGYDGWGAKVKPELEAQATKFNALAIIEEFVTSILRIYISFNDETNFSKTIESRARIAQIISQSEKYFEDDYCLFSASEKEGDKVTFNISWIPASLFQKIENYISLKNEI
ncbi:hypothetical protein [Methylophaga sp.]|uniref:hypothetical protein n=1 Tax=Methylophaga sp. TaxID=2024840 RepID=UPI003A8EE181